MNDNYFEDEADPVHLNDMGMMVAALGTLVVLVLAFFYLVRL